MKELSKDMLNGGCVGRFYLRLRFNSKLPIPSSRRMDVASVNLYASFLVKVKREALRRGVWFKLSRVERAIFDLTMKYVRRPKSMRLVYALAKVIVKIKALLASPLRWFMGQIGKPIARRLSKIAEGWGNKEAAKWAQDEGFIRFLTVTDKVFQSLTWKR